MRSLAAGRHGIWTYNALLAGMNPAERARGVRVVSEARRARRLYEHGVFKFGSGKSDFVEGRLHSHLLERWIASGLPLQELSPGGSKKRPVT